jgi:uncharacterized repeat protein (TIGR01451 family)/fimbrial isopeptide formation D2 family protein
MTGLAKSFNQIHITTRRVIQMTFITKQAGLLRSARRWGVLGLVLALLVGLSTLAGVSSFTGGATSLALQGPLPKAYFNPTDVPPEVLIGETFTFKVRFKNTGAIGYGPFIDLAIDFHGADNNTIDPTTGNPGPCDGIDFLNAQMVAVNPGPLALTSTKYGNTNPASCPAASALHPYAGVGTVTFPTGWQLVTIELPFGSFDASQPEIVVEVTAKVHDFADVNVPLQICERGGFRFGATATGGTPILEPNTTNNVNTWNCEKTTPTVFKIKKEYLSNYDEDEAVAGPNFVGYYPLKYKITVDIADGQTIKNLQITDNLPTGLQYVANSLAVTVLGLPASTFPAASPPCKNAPPTPNFPVAVSVPTGPNGTIQATLCNPITGTTDPDEVVITFEFYIPANVLDKDCKNAPVKVPNDVKATGDWDPLDPRDPTSMSPPGTTVPVTSDITQEDHILYAKCMAIQKSVKVFTDTGAPGPTPGDTLEYTLNFQISDYHTIGKIVIVDRISDGQLFVTTPSAPMLTIQDQFGNYPNVPISPSVTGDPHSQVKKCPVKGTTNLVFDVSAALAAAATPSGHPRHLAGILTGGLAAAPPSTTPAVGTLVFYAQIRDDFSNAQSPGDKFVDKHDPLCNEVEIQGTVYKNEANPQTVPSPVSPTQIATDDSRSQISIVTDILTKSVYAVKRGNMFVCANGFLQNTYCAPGVTPDVRPGDQVTFRIEKTIPSGDAENLTIQDWLPLPIFNIAGISFNNTICGIPGPPNSGCLGPSDTLSAFINNPAIPSFSADPPTNSIMFNYGTFNDPTNTPRKIDLLFTVTVTNKPFADGLFLTNEARECEKNTFDVTFCQVAVAQVHVREPKLSIKKGVVRTDNPNGQFGVYNPSTGTFTPGPAPVPTPSMPPSSCPRVPLSNTNPINSANLGNFINSDLNSVDAGDWVTFAIAIENTGGAPAYNIELADIIPLDAVDKPSCFEPDFGGLCVTYGNGTPIPFTTAPGGHGRIIIKLNPSAALDPGAPVAPPNGMNIVIITFNAKLLDKDKFKAGCCENKAELIKYGSSPPPPTIPNFVDAGIGGPFEDNAWVCVKAKPYAKCIQNTSEMHTIPQQTAQNGTVDAAIGEIVRFRLIVVIPEGTTQNFQITDLLPTGLTYVGNPRAIFVADTPVTNPLGIGTVKGQVSCPGKPLPTDPITVSPSTFPFGTGTDPTFPAAPINITNNDPNGPDLEFLIIEFNAQVDNILGNQASTTLTNRFEVKYQDAFSGQQVSSPAGPSGPVNVHIVEPKLTLTKTANPTSVVPGGTVQYTVTITNTGTATAFDVVFTDTLPSDLTPVSTSLSTSPAALGCTGSISGQIVTVNCPTVPKAPDPNLPVTITYQATVSPTAQCNTTLTNKATVTWTSLPGPQGTPPGPGNPTGQQTVGPSGAATPPNPVVNGERNGSSAFPPNPPNSPDPPNDYHATASATITVVCRCDVAIKKTVTPVPGTTLVQVTITLTVPAGQTCAPGTVVVGDQQPSGMTFGLPGSLVVTPASHWNCSATTSSNLSCTNTTTLTGAYTATFTFDATVQPGITITNCATATVSDTLISQSCVTFSIPKAQCDLKIEKFTDPAQPVAGQPFAFVVKVTNVGKGPCAPTTTVTDNLPIGFLVTSFNPNTADGWTCPSGPPGIVCNNPTLTLQPSQSSMVFAVVGTFTVGAGVTNCAELQNQNDTDPSNNKDCVTVMFVQPPKCDLAIKKEVKPSPLVSGQPATVTITVTNVGNAPCPGPTTVTETVPTGLTLVSASGPGWSCIGPICTYPLPIPVNGSVSVTYTFNVTAPPGTAITNCATVSNPNDPLNPSNPGNNQSCVTINVIGLPPPPDLALVKLLDGQLRVEQEATYVLRVANGGGGPTSGPIVVSDPLPAGLRFVSASGPGWSCAAQGQNVTCRNAGPIQPGQTSTILLRVRVAAPAGTQITNCATVETAGDANPANNRACHTSTVQR